MDLNIKIEKLEMDIEHLLERKNKIDKQIKAKQDKIKDYQSILNQKVFDETNDVLKTNGLSLDELLNAIKNNDLLSLQEKLEEVNNQ